MDLKKRCQWCGKYFIAHKMTTLYCSSSCIDKAYKAKKKQQIKEQVEEEQQSKLPIVGSIGQKPFLSPQEAACLLGVSLPTIYRYMAQGLFKALRTQRELSSGGATLKHGSTMPLHILNATIVGIS